MTGNKYKLINIFGSGIKINDITAYLFVAEGPFSADPKEAHKTAGNLAKYL